MLSARIAAIADPRLSPRTVHDLKPVLLSAVASINAVLAAEAAHSGDLGTVDMHVTVLRDAGVDPTVMQQLFRRHAKQISSAVTAWCESVWDDEDLMQTARQLLSRAQAPLAFLATAYPEGHAAHADATNNVGMTVYELLQAAEPPWGERMAVLERIVGLITWEARQALVIEELDTARGHHYVSQITDLVQSIISSPEPSVVKSNQLKGQVEPVLTTVARVMGRTHWSYQAALGVLERAFEATARAGSPSEPMIPTITFEQVDTRPTKVNYKLEDAARLVARAVATEFQAVSAEARPVIVLMGSAGNGPLSLGAAVGWYLRTLGFAGDVVGDETEPVMESNVIAKMAEVRRSARDRSQLPYLIVVGGVQGVKGDITVMRRPNCDGLGSLGPMFEPGSVYILGIISDPGPAQAVEYYDEVLGMARVIAMALSEFYQRYACR